MTQNLPGYYKESEQALSAGVDAQRLRWNRQTPQVMAVSIGGHNPLGIDLDVLADNTGCDAREVPIPVRHSDVSEYRPTTPGATRRTTWMHVRDVSGVADIGPAALEDEEVVVVEEEPVEQVSGKRIYICGAYYTADELDLDEESLNHLFGIVKFPVVQTKMTPRTTPNDADDEDVFVAPQGSKESLPTRFSRKKGKWIKDPGFIASAVLGDIYTWEARADKLSPWVSHEVRYEAGQQCPFTYNNELECNQRTRVIQGPQWRRWVSDGDDPSETANRHRAKARVALARLEEYRKEHHGLRPAEFAAEVAHHRAIRRARKMRQAEQDGLHAWWGEEAEYAQQA